MALGAIGAALAAGGAAIGGGGRRSTVGYSAEQEEALRRTRAAIARLQGLVQAPSGIDRIQDVFGISQEEQRRRRELIDVGASRTTEDVIDAIRAEAGRAGVLNAPGFVTGKIGRALTDIGFQRLGQEVSLDESIRGGKQAALGFETDINKYLAGAVPESMVGGPMVRERTPTFGEIVGPAMSGVGGQLLGFGLANQYFNPNATISSAFASSAPDVGGLQAENDDYIPLRGRYRG